MFSIFTTDTLSQGFNFADPQPATSYQDFQPKTLQQKFCSKIAQAALSLSSDAKLRQAIELCFSPEFNSLSRPVKISVLKQFQMTPEEHGSFLKVRTAILELEKARLKALENVKDLEYPGFGVLRAEEQISPSYNHPFVGKINPQSLQQEDNVFSEDIVNAQSSPTLNSPLFFLEVARAAFWLSPERRIEVALEMSLDKSFNQLDRSTRLDILKAFNMSEAEYEVFRTKRQQVIYLEADRLRDIQKIESAAKSIQKPTQFFSTEGLMRACNHKYYHSFIGKIDPSLVETIRIQEDYDMLTELYQDIISRHTPICQNPQPSVLGLTSSFMAGLSSLAQSISWNPFQKKN